MNEAENNEVIPWGVKDRFHHDTGSFPDFLEMSHSEAFINKVQDLYVVQDVFDSLGANLDENDETHATSPHDNNRDSVCLRVQEDILLTPWLP
jgi:hypothetical protein